MDAHRGRISDVVAGALHECLAEFAPRGLGRSEGPALGAWFLGPRAENEDLLRELVLKAVEHHAAARKHYKPTDPPWITREIKSTHAYQESKRLLYTEFTKLLNKLNGSVPFFSYRYQGHMLWDTALPAMVGYFGAMLCNQNNVASEASPVTTCLEMLVGDDLCRMLGYFVPERVSTPSGFGFQLDDESQRTPPQRPIAWGHITCDGSVANIEALWASRNLKYYPIAVAQALLARPELKKAKDLEVSLPDGSHRRLLDLDTWQLLNLKADDTLPLGEEIATLTGLCIAALDSIILPFTLQALGYLEFGRRFPEAMAKDAAILVPATAHYSWPKAASLLGVGRDNLIRVPVDLHARMSLPDLEKELNNCLADHRPVVTVVAVLGTTEESAVDPLTRIIGLRDNFRQRGLEFTVHVDAAWGGYFASMLPPLTGTTAVSQKKTHGSVSPRLVGIARLDDNPEVVMSPYVNEQYRALVRADSITVDPHKAGYVPYPAGGLCYRNSAMRHLVAFTAPIVYHGQVDRTVGVYGIEGSKPGAAAAATFLSHRVIGVDRGGYGRILARCMFNSKRFYAALVTMAIGRKDFTVAPLQRVPAEWTLTYIKNLIVTKDNDTLLQDNEAMDVLRQLGSDQIIIGYAFNFYTHYPKLNQSVKNLNRLNDAIFRRLSVLTPSSYIPRTPLFVTASSLDPEIYGRALVGDFMRRLGVAGAPDAPIQFLISTTMDPWLTDTAEGNFIPILIRALRNAVRSAIATVR